MKKLKNKKISAKEFDQKFDRGENMMPHLDKRSIRVNHPLQRINLDLPRPLLEKLDKEADRIGVPRTALIKLWISERIDKLAA